MTVALGEICTVRSSVVDPTQPHLRDLPHVAPDSIEQDSGHLRPIRSALQDGVTSGKYHFVSGDVLYSKIRPSLNKVALIEFSGLCSADMYALVADTDRLDSGFLVHLLRSSLFLSHAAATSGRANIPKINREQLLAFEFELPTLNEQRHTAKILDRASTLQTMRRHALAKLDELRISTFCDIFGDPIRNPRDLPFAAIGSVADVMTGNSPSRAEPDNFGRDIEWIKSDNLGDDTATVAGEWLSARGRSKARIAPAGSVLVTCIAGSATSIGKASMVDRDVAVNPQINAVLPSSQVDATFVLAQLKAAPSLVRQRSTGGMKGLVSKSSFRSIEILVPPLQDQWEFARQIDDMRMVQAAAKQEMTVLNELAESLRRRAFRGEL